MKSRRPTAFTRIELLVILAVLVVIVLFQPQGLLSGDRFLTSGAQTTNGLLTLATGASVSWLAEPHHSSGHAAWVDGSVTVFSNADWPSTLARSKSTPIRLAIPQ
jgi:hypothetical protein